MHLHEFDYAKERFLFALQFEPNNKEIRHALETLKKAHHEATTKDAKMYQRVLKESAGLYSEPVDLSDGHAPLQVVTNPRVWLSFSMGGSDIGQIEIELWADKLPRTAENFRQLCTGEKGLHPVTRLPMRYKGCTIHRVVPEMAIQGGDFVFNDGRGGCSIYGNYFADEVSGRGSPRRRAGPRPTTCASHNRTPRSPPRRASRPQSTTRQDCSRWPTRAATPTAHNSTSPPQRART